MASPEAELASKLQKIRWINEAGVSYDTSSKAYIRIVVSYQRDAFPPVAIRAFAIAGITSWYHVVPILLDVVRATILLEHLEAAEVELALTRDK